MVSVPLSVFQHWVEHLHDDLLSFYFALPQGQEADNLSAISRITIRRTKRRGTQFPNYIVQPYILQDFKHRRQLNGRSLRLFHSFNSLHLRVVSSSLAAMGDVVMVVWLSGFWETTTMFVSQMSRRDRDFQRGEFR